MFRLLRYFSVASLIGFVIVTVLLGYLYRQTAVRNLTEMAEEKNVAVTLGFANSLWDEVVPFIEVTLTQEPHTLYNHPGIKKLRTSVIDQVVGLSVVKVKIYNPNGITVFSTEAEQIGSSEADNTGFLTAWKGVVISELTHRDTFNTFDGIIEDQDVLATYVPIRSEGQSGPIVGVIELYSNVTPLLRRINTVQRNIILGVAGILAALYGVLVLIVQRADHILRAQQSEREDVQLEMRQQQRTLATFKERERLARELHDSLGQVLGYVKMQSQAVLELYEQGLTQQGGSYLKRLIEAVQNAHVDVREYILNLQSSVLEDQDFVTALRTHLDKFAKFSDIRTRLELPTPAYTLDLGPHAEAQLMRIVQEALTNIRKHAKACQAVVSISEEQNNIQVSIADNGHGFQIEVIPAPNGHHVGLQIMRERAAEIGGEIEIQSEPSLGTEITIVLPKSTTRLLDLSPETLSYPTRPAVDS
ncbi:MAG: sensor histidine kinase [Chloroflexota bacterium]